MPRPTRILDIGVVVSFCAAWAIFASVLVGWVTTWLLQCFDLRPWLLRGPWSLVGVTGIGLAYAAALLAPGCTLLGMLGFVQRLVTRGRLSR